MDLQTPYLVLRTNFDFLDNLLDLPNNLGRIMSNALAILIIFCFLLGVIFAIIGAIKWITGRDERGGKKAIVRGIVLIILSLVGGSIGISVVTFS